MTVVYPTADFMDAVRLLVGHGFIVVSADQQTGEIVVRLP